MSNPIHKKYNSKVLLFGEYTVLDGSAALAIPFGKYCGEWSYDKSDQKRNGLLKLKNYLASLYLKGEITNVDFDQFEKDLSRGLSFNSTIPTGYGLGSSGSLTAAFFDRYVRKDNLLDIPELKEELAKIESCFHGDSSGLDPLVSYLNSPLLMHPDGDVEIMEADRDHLLGDIRILDTGIPRETAPLVAAYRYTIEKSDEFAKAVQELAKVADEVISAYILNDRANYISKFKYLSELQLGSLSMLIPSLFQDLWQDGLRNDAFYMKLCGAGGGGCMLLHVVDELKTEEILKGQHLLNII